MATTITRYNTLTQNLANGTIDLDTNTIKLALVDSGYVFSAAHTTMANVTNEEADGNGYTTGGATLAGSAVTLATGTAKWDATDVTWTFTNSKTFRGGVLYKYVDGTASNNILIAYILFDDTAGGTDITINSIAFTVQWSANGILTIA